MKSLVLSGFIEKGLPNIDLNYTTHNGQKMTDKYDAIQTFLRDANKPHDVPGCYESLNAMIRSHKKPSENDKNFVGSFLHSDWSTKTEDQKQKLNEKFREFPLLYPANEIRFCSIVECLEDIIKFLPLLRKIRSLNDEDDEFTASYPLLRNVHIDERFVLWLYKSTKVIREFIKKFEKENFSNADVIDTYLYAIEKLRGVFK